MSLVTIPIRVYSATNAAAEIHFNQLHRECQTRIQYKKWCPHCEREVKNDEIAAIDELDDVPNTPKAEDRARETREGGGKEACESAQDRQPQKSILSSHLGGNEEHEEFLGGKALPLQILHFLQGDPVLGGVSFRA